MVRSDLYPAGAQRAGLYPNSQIPPLAPGVSAQWRRLLCHLSAVFPFHAAAEQSDRQMNLGAVAAVRSVPILLPAGDAPVPIRSGPALAAEDKARDRKVSDRHRDPGSAVPFPLCGTVPDRGADHRIADPTVLPSVGEAPVGGKALPVLRSALRQHLADPYVLLRHLVPGSGVCIQQPNPGLSADAGHLCCCVLRYRLDGARHQNSSGIWADKVTEKHMRNPFSSAGS